MIYLKPISLETPDDLKKAIQTAIELEHATIPPYLTAYFTLQNTGNETIATLISSIFNEEMLHLSIAANLLNAIGGSPVLNKPGFISTYPGPLPGGVEGGLKVPIAKFSLKLVEDIFMKIEEPEKRIRIQGAMKKDAPITIGKFYDTIKEKITKLEGIARTNGKTIFTGNPKKQMTFENFYSENLLFPIIDEKTALRGIDIIIDQGEGNTKNPFVNRDDDTRGVPPEPAHFYRFEEIVKGKTLVKKDSDADVKYSYSGAIIPFHNPEKVPNMWENPEMNSYPVNSLAYVNSKLFNYNYTCLLNCLHRTFNGEPAQMTTAMGLMYSLRLYALRLLSIPDPNHRGYVAGPSFEFVSDEDLSPKEKEIIKKETKSISKKA